MHLRRDFGRGLFLSLLVAGVAHAAPVHVQPISVAKAQELSQDKLMQEYVGPPQDALDRWPVTGYPVLSTDANPTSANRLESLSRTFDRSVLREFSTQVVAPPFSRQRISLTNAWGNNLDTPPCSLVAALDTGTVSYFSGITAGDAYKIWFDPAGCAGCAAVYPYGVDSVRFTLVQDDGSPRDTVTIGIDIECAALAPDDPCNGPGHERCFSIWNIALPADTANGFLSVYDITLPLQDCRVDGPFFVGIYHLGHTVTDPTIFHPVAGMAPSQPQPAACQAWTNLLGNWSSWGSTWIDPDPGMPFLTVYGECNDTGPGEIEPCPVECGHDRISAPLAYYVSGTTAVWQYYDLEPAQLPYHPTAITFTMYYDTTGTTQDTTEFLITLGCPNNGNICCAPSDLQCAGVAAVVRANGGDNQIQTVNLDLDPMTCCLSEGFFVGIIITRHTGTAISIPKFLSSNRVTEQANGNDIPPCHQWSYGGGTYTPFPSGGQIGWFEMAIVGSCGSCPTAPQACTPQIVNCAGATQLSCSNNPQVFENQTTVGGPSTVSQYCCNPWDESGPEKVYSITIPANGSISAAISNTGGQDLDIFVLSSCDPEFTIACADSAVNVTGLAAGTYFIVVDGFNGAQGTFTLTLNAPCTGAAGCPTSQCGTGLNGGGTILVWDGELLPDGNVAYLCQGTPVHGNDMTIKIVDANCNLVSTIDIGGDATNQVARGLAYDDRDGSWWTATFVAPKALRRYSATGTLIAQFDSTYFPGQTSTFSFSGLGFDADNNHLWAVMSSLGRYTEFDLSNPAAPTIRQAGLMPIHAGAGYSAAGLDYDECNNRLLVSTFRGSPLTRGEIECWQDNNPAGIGGVTMLSYCGVTAGGVTQNWGIARSAAPNGISLPNLDATANSDHRVWTTTAPCGAVPPAAPTAATAYRSANDIIVRWNAPAAGRYIIYKTTVKNNDGNPDGGGDPNFQVEATVTVNAAGPAAYTDEGAFAAEAFMNYVVVGICP